MIVSHSHKKPCCRILVWNQQYLFLKTNLLIFNKPDHLTQNVQKLLFMQTEKKNPWTHSSLTFLFKNQSGNQITLTAPDPPGPAPFIFTDMFIKHAPPLGSHTGCNPVSRWKRREKEHLRGSKLRGRIHFGPEELKKKNIPKPDNKSVRKRGLLLLLCADEEENTHLMVMKNPNKN